MIVKLLIFIESYFAVGIIAMYIGSRTAGKEARKQRWIKLITYFLIVHSLLFITLQGKIYFYFLAGLILTSGFIELIYTFSKHSNDSIAPYQRSIIICCYIFFVTGTVFFSLGVDVYTIIYVYMITGVFDGFSQLTGQIFGKNALAKVISPNKTIEGSIGGLVVAIYSGYLLRGFTGFNLAEAVLFAIVISFGALIGDLAASYVKRIHELKDFNNVIPGHGGILDRFDSFIGAAALYQLFLLFS